MSSRIEQIIEEIEEYVESCKYQPLSTTKIVVILSLSPDCLINFFRRRARNISFSLHVSAYYEI